MARTGGTQREIDRGFEKLKRRWMGHTNGVAVAVGVQGEAGAKSRGGPGPEGEQIFDEELTNVLLAAVHEFGTADGHVPPRKWLRGFVDENEKKIRKLIRTLQQQWMDGHVTHEQALGQLGAKLVGMIQTRIDKGLAPPLAPSTAAARAKPREGHKGPRKLTPLVDTGELKQSITWDVRKRGGG